MMETELKLVIQPEGFAALQASGVLVSDPEVSQLAATYFDTQRRKLARHGLSLRVRRKGSKFVQTVKAGNGSAGGLFERSEWELQVRANEPVADERTPVLGLLGGDLSRLAPAFTVEVERHTWIVRGGDGEIELVLDRGQVRAGDARSVVSEVELELRSGPVSQLFDLARKLDEITPTRLGVMTKSERGWALRDGRSKAFKAEPVALTAGIDAAAAFQQIGASCIRQFRLNEDRWRSEHTAEALHQARVAVRRMRSALVSFRKLIAADSRTAQFRADLRWLACELGEARNVDVLYEKCAGEPLGQTLAERRASAYATVASILETTRARRLWLDLLGWLYAGDWLTTGDPLLTQSARGFAADALDRLRRRIKRRRSALRGEADEPRHEIRKDAKKLRYAAEFFAALFPRKAEKRKRKAFLPILERLQDDLGALNDMATAPEVLLKLELEDHTELLGSAGHATKDELIDSAAAALDELLSTKPFWRDKRSKAPAADPLRPAT